MANLWIWMSIFVVATASAFPEIVPDREDRSPRYPFTFVTRAGWNARAPTSTTRLTTPVRLVIIHHTATGACTTRAACSASMRSMQNHHMNTNRWPDFGYNFAVGDDGATYEGRGWSTVGAHAAGYNAQSIGIALIGSFGSANPPARQLTTAQQLIAEGVRRGFIARNYRLIGHRQVSATECPGAALFRTIQRWTNFSWNP